MDLRSNSVFWPRQHPRAVPNRRRLNRDLQCDVAILGAGLTGAFIGHALSKAGVDVALLDKRDVARGSTSASTALVLYEIDQPLFKLVRMRGRSAAVRAYQLCRDAIFQLQDLMRELDDDCGFERKLGIFCAATPAHIPDLRTELRVRRAAGFQVNYLSSSELKRTFSISAPGAIVSLEAAQLDPYRLTHQLATGVERRGGRIFTRTLVTQIEEQPGGVVLRTANGKVVRAKRVVLATGYERQSDLPRGLVKLLSTYAIATHPLPASDSSCKQCILWESGEAYTYMRATADRRIIAGGADEDFTDAESRDRKILVKANLLQRKVRGFFPATSVKVDYAWAGTFGETKDSLPIIGSLPGRGRVIHALCYGANGTNFAVIAADLLRDHILGKRNRNAALFSPTR